MKESTEAAIILQPETKQSAVDNAWWIVMADEADLIRLQGAAFSTGDVNVQLEAIYI